MQKLEKFEIIRQGAIMTNPGDAYVIAESENMVAIEIDLRARNAVVTPVDINTSDVPTFSLTVGGVTTLDELVRGEAEGETIIRFHFRPGWRTYITESKKHCLSIVLIKQEGLNARTV